MATTVFSIVDDFSSRNGYNYWYYMQKFVYAGKGYLKWNRTKWESENIQLLTELFANTLPDITPPTGHPHWIKTAFYNETQQQVTGYGWSFLSSDNVVIRDTPNNTLTWQAEWNEGADITLRKYSSNTSFTSWNYVGAYTLQRSSTQSVGISRFVDSNFVIPYELQNYIYKDGSNVVLSQRSHLKRPEIGWRAPVSGNVKITFPDRVRNLNPGKGTSRRVKIYKNNLELWDQYIAYSSTIGYSTTLNFSVVEGDWIYFHLRTDTTGAPLVDCDVIWNPIITLTHSDPLPGFAFYEIHRANIYVWDGSNFVKSKKKLLANTDSFNKHNMYYFE
jgi:hypothetical protein